MASFWELLDKIPGGSSNSSILKDLPPELISKAGGLITLLKAAGVLFIIYIIFLIIKSIFDIRRNIRIAKTYHKVNEIDRKIDLLLEKKGIKETDKISKKQKSSKK